MSIVRYTGKVDRYGRREALCHVCDGTMLVERRYEELGVCESCTRAVGDAWCVAHSGEHHPDFNPEAYEADVARMRARFPNKKKTIPGKLRTQVMERDEYACKACGVRKNLTVDHIYPEVLGGPPELDNLQTLCRSCNCSKKDRVFPKEVRA